MWWRFTLAQFVRIVNSTCSRELEPDQSHARCCAENSATVSLTSVKLLLDQTIGECSPHKYKEKNVFMEFRWCWSLGWWRERHRYEVLSQYLCHSHLKVKKRSKSWHASNNVAEPRQITDWFVGTDIQVNVELVHPYTIISCATLRHETWEEKISMCASVQIYKTYPHMHTCVHVRICYTQRERERREESAYFSLILTSLFSLYPIFFLFIWSEHIYMGMCMYTQIYMYTCTHTCIE